MTASFQNEISEQSRSFVFFGAMGQSSCGVCAYVLLVFWTHSQITNLPHPRQPLRAYFPVVNDQIFRNHRLMRFSVYSGECWFTSQQP